MCDFCDEVQYMRKGNKKTKSSGFEEFLKEQEEIFLPYTKLRPDETFFELKRALGEWALEQIVQEDEGRKVFESELRHFDADGYSGNNWFECLKEIAVACLGEKEIKKRLRDLK